MPPLFVHLNGKKYTKYLLAFRKQLRRDFVHALLVIMLMNYEFVFFYYLGLWIQLNHA